MKIVGIIEKGFHKDLKVEVQNFLILLFNSIANPSLLHEIEFCQKQSTNHSLLFFKGKKMILWFHAQLKQKILNSNLRVSSFNVRFLSIHRTLIIKSALVQIMKVKVLH